MQITNYGTVNISSDVHGIRDNLIRAATVLWRMSMLMLSRKQKKSDAQLYKEMNRKT